ncbi:unnamed protein product [Phytomonas sp. EM1]|nr:unnamed protein product [Phytomonas sp. EM1]|eukprot:CCW64186.1 unnamed protein product [Phytomonas sp. isolate EM1]
MVVKICINTLQLRRDHRGAGLKGWEVLAKENSSLRILTNLSVYKYHIESCLIATIEWDAVYLGGILDEKSFDAGKWNQSIVCDNFGPILRNITRPHE